MRKVLVVAAREYRASVKTKSFLIGIILMPVLMGGGIIAQALFKDHVDLRPKRFAVADRTAGQQLYPVLDKAVKEYNQKSIDPLTQLPKKANFHLEALLVEKELDLEKLRLAISDRIRKGELLGFLEIGSDILEAPQTSTVSLDSKEAKAEVPLIVQRRALRYQTNRPSFQDFSKWAKETIEKEVQRRRAEGKGITPADLTGIVAPVPLLRKGLTVQDPDTGEVKEGQDQNPAVALLLPGGLLVLMFMVVLIGATPLMHGVIEEKMQRIAEVLLGSIQPFQLMMGKLLGMAAVSLTIALVYLVGAYWAVHHFGYGEYLTLEIIVWFLVYQILALFMFGSLFAAVGAACTDLKEAQAMVTPVTILIALPMFVWVNVVREPTSSFSTGFSLFPLATPMLMIARLAVPPGIPIWQPILGVVLVLLSTVLCVYVAGRIFRVGILLQGKGARFRDLVRWVIKG